MMPLCCFIGCLKRAMWAIVSGPAPEDYTHSCDVHIADLLTDAPEHRIYPLVERREEGVQP